MSEKIPVGADAIREKGWLAAHKWLLIRRFSQIAVIGLFLIGPLTGFWLVKGNLSASLTLDVLPLTDPFVLAQTLIAGHTAATTSLIGVAIIIGFYMVVGGRTFCSFVCPMNIVTDAARWLSKKLNLPKGFQPNRNARLWALGAVLVGAAVTGTAAWELLNPVSILHRSLVFGVGYAWTVVAAIFLFDLVVSRRGWCGHLCPHGALYGLIGKASLVRVSAKKRYACNDCMDCFAVCPESHVITPALRGAELANGPVIFSGDCTNCGRCIDVCAKEVFAFDVSFNNKAPSVSGGADVKESSTRQAA